MENANYKVNIKDIYVGDVKGIKKTSDIYRSRILCFEKTDEPFYKIYHNRPHMCPPGKDLLLINLFKYEFKRSMLFVLDENKHANDLLFNSPHYPVLNISKDEDCLNSKICLSNNTYMMYDC